MSSAALTQLRFTDPGGHRFTAFATDAKRGQLADLELRHRRRARCEDRIRCAKDTGLRNLPLMGFAANQLWCEIVALACDPLAWTQMLALADDVRCQEPKRLRLRLLSVAGRSPPAAAGRGSASPSAGPGLRHHRRHHPPAGHPVRLTRLNTPATWKEQTPGTVEPRPVGATAGQPGTARTRKSTPADHPRPADHGRERSRLM